MTATTSSAKPTILDLPIGLHAMGQRREFDSLGDVEVPADRYWGAQTQRSLEHFNIGNDRMPKEVYHAYGYVKKAAAVVNTRAGRRVPFPERASGRRPPRTATANRAAEAGLPRSPRARDGHRGRAGLPAARLLRGGADPARRAVVPRARTARCVPAHRRGE